MKADQPLLLKVNLSLRFQNHLGGWSQRKRAAPGRGTCSGLLFSSAGFVRMAVTFSWAITSREHSLWMQSRHLCFGTFQPHSFPLHHVLGGELFKQMTTEVTKIVKSTQNESCKETMYSPGHLPFCFFPLASSFLISFLPPSYLLDQIYSPISKFSDIKQKHLFKSRAQSICWNPCLVSAIPEKKGKYSLTHN